MTVTNTYKFKFYRNAVKVFKTDFPKFCAEHGVWCLIKSKNRLFRKTCITMTLIGLEADIQYVETQLNLLLKYVI